MKRNSYKRIIPLGVTVVAGVLILIVIVSSINSSTSLAGYIGKYVSVSIYYDLFNLSGTGINIVNSTLVKTVGVLPLNYSSNSKPAVIFVGAEWCPYCGAMRWALVLALMRFGNLSGLEYMLSSSTDVYPNVPTFTFVNTSYSSQYISFVSFEVQDRQGNSLQSVSQNVYTAWNQYGKGSIPFIIIGYFYQVGSTINPGLLSGKNWTYVVSQLSNASSPIYKEVYATANLFTAEICKVDGNQPLNVCHIQSIQQIEAQLPSASQVTSYYVYQQTFMMNEGVRIVD